MSRFLEAAKHIEDHMPVEIEGQIADVIGLTIECNDFAAPVGAQVEIHCRHSREKILGEVVGFREDRSILMPYGEMRGFSRGDKVRLLHATQKIGVGDELIGRVLNAQGDAVDGKPKPRTTMTWNIYNAAPDAFSRPVIAKPITTGVKAIDGIFQCGKGQRMGIFAGSGVGKSTLLSMITRNTNADVIVLGLVGERGRELREFLEKDLGEEGLKRAVVVCETSDRPPLLRVKAAFTATAIAEYFRAQGKSVMLLVDSLTRMAMAQREIGLSAGEPPTTKGYPPSVFNLMPRLLERSGAAQNGSITAFYTVLVEGDDENEPIADTVRGILDGHIWLERALANRGHFPAIAVGASISRLMASIAEESHKDAAMRLRDLYATYSDAEDLINIGAYRNGTNPKIDESIHFHDTITGFLKQRTHDVFKMEDTIRALKEAVGVGNESSQKAAPQVGAMRGGTMSPGMAGAIGGRGQAPSGNTPFNPQRPVAPAEANPRLVRPGQQRMPDQQPPAVPGQHRIQAPR